MSYCINNITLYRTNFEKKIINEELKMDLISLGNNNYESINGTIIHIFDILPFMRNIKYNKQWFNKNLYHFKQITL